MDNEQFHKNLYKKKLNIITQILNSGEGVIEEIPSYYGETIDSDFTESQDDIIKAASKLILGESVQTQLPPFLTELLKQDKTLLVAKLFEYYTRHKLLSSTNKNIL